MSGEQVTRIFFQKHTVIGRIPRLDSMYESHATTLCQADTSVSFGSLPAETYDVELPERLVRYGAVESLFAVFFGLQAKRVEAAGYDAYIIGTSQDPGIELARSIVDIPVIGYGQAAAMFARTVADRFTFVGFIPELEDPIRRNMGLYGFGDLLTPFEHLTGGAGVMARALQGDVDEFLEQFVSASRRAIAGGAQAVIPGEGLPNEVLWSEGITEVDGVPIVDANGVALLAAELQVRMHRTGVLPPSHTGYFRARPPEDMLDHLIQLYQPVVMEGSSTAIEQL